MRCLRSNMKTTSRYSGFVKRVSRLMRERESTTERGNIDALGREIDQSDALKQRISDAKLVANRIPESISAASNSHYRWLGLMGGLCLVPYTVLLARVFECTRLAAGLGILSLLLLLLALFLGAAISENLRNREDRDIAKGWVAPFLLLFAYAMDIPDCQLAASSNPVTKLLILMAGFVAQFGASLIYVRQFSSPADQQISETYESEIARRNAEWLRSRVPSPVKEKAERRLDLAFAFFFAVIVNAGNLILPLEFKGIFLGIVVVLLVCGEVLWLSQLERWRAVTGSRAVRGAKEFAVIPVALVMVLALAVDLYLDVSELATDWLLFGSKLVVIGLTTALPFWGATMYKRSVIPVLGTSDFGLATAENDPFVVVDQSTQSVRPGAGEWPRWHRKYRLDLEIVDGSQEPLHWSIVWRRQRATNEWKYDYSTLWQGKYFFLFDIDPKWRSKLIEALHLCELRGSNGFAAGVNPRYMPSVEGENQGESIATYQLCETRVPPLVVGGSIA